MKLSNSGSNQAGMGLRCKDGDMAVIVGDVPGCEGNIGCIVQVRGPTIKLSGYICWRIKPLDNRKILICEFKGVIVSEKVFWNSRIGHPDCFLLPIRPPEDGKTIEISNDLKIERTDYANV
jgi:hypothetical protein